MRRSLPALFLAAEATLYAAFLALDVTGISGPDVCLKYAGILLCLAFSLVCARHGGSRLVPAALLLTAAADSLLLVADAFYAPGIFLFLGVQVLYLARLLRATGRTRAVLRAAAALAAGLLLFMLGQASPLNLLSGLYFSQLAVNTVVAWTVPGRPWRRFALGLTLFVGCDLCVGIFNVPELFPAPLYRFARVGMWLFYLPSQVLIALSALPEERIRYEAK